jgi:hypothetical protein
MDTIHVSVLKKFFMIFFTVVKYFANYVSYIVFLHATSTNSTLVPIGICYNHEKTISQKSPMKRIRIEIPNKLTGPGRIYLQRYNSR